MMTLTVTRQVNGILEYNLVQKIITQQIFVFNVMHLFKLDYLPRLLRIANHPRL